MVMHSTARRSFSIWDAMVLVAATAVALAMLVTSGTSEYHLSASHLSDWVGDVVEGLRRPDKPWPSWEWTIFLIQAPVILLLFPFCWAWTLAILGLRFRHPRPRRHRLACLPGAVACWSAAIPLVPGFVGCLLNWERQSAIFLTPGPTTWTFGGYDELHLLFLPGCAGLAVLGSWTTLLLGRRWRAEPSWLDRIGRFLGIYWISSIIPPVLIFMPF
jgi:hypothetical protein